MQKIDELHSITSCLIGGYEPFNIINKEKVILYGAGSLGRMATNLLSMINVKPKYIIDQEAAGNIDDIKIIKPQELSLSEFTEFTFVICISSIEFMPIYTYLQNLGCKNIIQFYDYAEVFFKDTLGNGWACFNPTPEDIEEISKVCQYLEHDKHSLAHYLQFLWWRLRRIEKIDLEYPVLSSQKYFKAPCMPKLTENESFLDGGAHFGTTTKSFLDAVDTQFNTIWALEPDEKNIAIMKTEFSDVDNIKYLPIALSDTDELSNFVDGLGFASKVAKNGNTTIQTKTIDSLNINPTIIKLHLEGYELKALSGAKETIDRTRSILMVLADHNKDGLYKIAQYLMSLEGYKIYFYLHDYCGNSAILYAIPKERFYNE